MTDQKQSKKRSRIREVRPLTTDERASFFILALYLFAFFVSAFIYWDSLMLKLAGVFTLFGGGFLFYAALFISKGHDDDKESKHPLRSYLLSFFLMLLMLFLFRFVGGLIDDSQIALFTLYGGTLICLVIFRKALIQVVSLAALSSFIFVTAYNREMILSGELKFKDAIHQCGQALFRIGPIQDVANMLIAGNYVNYLNKVDYRDEQINILATREVIGSRDDELEKTKALLSFVSNEIYYVSDPNDGVEYAKDPIQTIIAGGGDCEDQTLVLCSLLESVGLKTYIAFTAYHVFALVQFDMKYPELKVEPYVYIDGHPCYALDPADPGAQIGYSAASRLRIERVFDVRKKNMVSFELLPQR
ncbi:transglutaminase domain-containing protein [Pontiella agarivorans]|nr:transglutaminase domain-containing protein [Pontiella agarivorans]